MSSQTFNPLVVFFADIRRLVETISSQTFDPLEEMEEGNSMTFQMGNSRESFSVPIAEIGNSSEAEFGRGNISGNETKHILDLVQSGKYNLTASTNVDNNNDNPKNNNNIREATTMTTTTKKKKQKQKSHQKSSSSSSSS